MPLTAAQAIQPHLEIDVVVMFVGTLAKDP